jgi:TRAP-type mannitol/chloroaromatic compound transport system permease large subunit
MVGVRARLAFQARTLDWKRTKQAVFLTAKTTWEWTAAGLLLCCWYLIPLCPTTQR